MSNVIIFSDLDGTLLDHYTYESAAADETLKQLKKAKIPVVLNTSKTFAELEVINQKLSLNAPFIVENGAAVYIPIGTFNQQPKDTKVVGNYWVKSFCSNRQHWLDLLNENATEYSEHYQNFESLSDFEITKITGLSLDEAKRAKQRQYGEPVHWIGNEETKSAFIEHLIDLGAYVTKGGRFIHIGGYCDKGQALIWLSEKYREHYNNNSIVTIALGDGENDTPMLEACDIAVQVKSPIHNFPKLYRQYNVTQTMSYGPAGWAEALQKLLENQFQSTPSNSKR